MKRYLVGAVILSGLVFAFQPVLAADTQVTQDQTQQTQETQVTTQEAEPLLIATQQTQQIKTFYDVTMDNPHYYAITYLRDKGVISGYPDGSFKPDQVVNRAEALKIILGGYGIAPQPALDSGANADYMDITDWKAWYYPYVNRASNESIVSGYPDSTFKPENTVNLVEALKMVINAEEVARLLKEEAASGQSFTGARGELHPLVLDQVSVDANPYADAFKDQWYAKYVEYAKIRGLIDADASNKVYPAQGLTRGKLAEAIFRVMYIAEKNMEKYPVEGAVLFHKDFSYESNGGAISSLATTDSFKLDDATSKQLADNKETIESFYVPWDDAGLYYFSTSDYLGQTWAPDMKSTNRIYSYEREFGVLKLIYTEKENRLLRTVGVEGSKLVLMTDGIDNSPGPCFSIWDGEFVSLDLNDAAAGLKAYTMPDYMVLAGKIESAICAKQM